MSEALDVPQHLIREILEGRCIAFIGAGFSAPALLGWPALLKALAKRLGSEQLEALANKATSPLEYEAVGQRIRDAFNSDELFEATLQKVLEQAEAGREQERRDEMIERLRLLGEIPFRAVLTTNYDRFVPSTQLTNYHEVLREARPWWNTRAWGTDRSAGMPVLRLHGEANGKSEELPVILGRDDYRKKLYVDSTHTSFLRSVFGSYTILYLGVSFTDAYLNELRSEAMAYLGADREGGRAPLGYAVLEDLDQHMQDFFKVYEGIEVLGYDSKGKKDFSGFDSWLKAIHGKTAPVERLGALIGELAERNTVLWIDPEQDNRNAPGWKLLKDAGASVKRLAGPNELDGEDLTKVALIISHYGHSQGGDPELSNVMAKLRVEAKRPPVVVFASPDYAAENRALAIRMGAWEYASGWDELFRLIEQLFGRATA